MRKYSIGDKEDRVWAGDLVTICEFITYCKHGTMIFYDLKNQCFRRVFYDTDYKGNEILNGWECSKTISDLLY